MTELILGVREGKKDQPLGDEVHIPLGSAVIENEPFGELAEHPVLLKNRLQLRGFRIVNPWRVQKNLPHLSPSLNQFIFEACPFLFL